MPAFNTTHSSEIFSRFVYYFTRILQDIKSRIDNNKAELAPAEISYDETEDWIIGGQSLSEYCMKMRYVEKNESRHIGNLEADDFHKEKLSVCHFKKGACGPAAV